MTTTDTPKYIDLMKWIKEQILSGEFSIGTKLPSENELGKKFSISRQTVRQATSVLESEGLLERRRGSGTYVSANKNITKPNTSKNIGVVLTYIDDYIFPSIVKGIERVLTKNGYIMQLAFTYNRVEKETFILENMLKSNIDGLIIEPAKSGIPYVNTDFYQKIKASGIPCIFAHADTNPLMGIPSVRMDDYMLGKAAAEYLIKHGHTNIAGVFKSDDMQGQLRCSGMLNALKEYDSLHSEKNIYWFATEDMEGMKQGKFDAEILDRLHDATALICYNDHTAERIMHTLERAGKKVPEDISLISFDNLDVDILQDVTTFDHPKRNFGKIIATQLLKLIQNPNFNASMKFPPKLIERSSVKIIE